MFPIVKNIYNHRLIHPIIHPPLRVLKITIKNYNRHNVFRLGAALAYYTIFSLPALLIVIIGLVGFFLGEAAVRGEVYSNLVDSVGTAAAQQIQNAVISIGTPNTNWWATVFGVSILFFVATGVFNALQSSLNHIFEVKSVPKRVKIIEIIINRVLSLGMVLSIGFLLFLSILFNALLLKISNFKEANEDYVHNIIPDFLIPYVNYLTDYFLVFLNLGLSVLLIAFFFAMLFRILPAVRLKWSYIWAGSFFSAILFWIGQVAMGVYLSNTTLISAYGAAGSIIIILLWVSYSAQLIFLGAEFIVALYDYRGVKIYPKKFARLLQNVKKKKISKRVKLDEISSNFLVEAPPSHHEIRMIEIFSSDIKPTSRLIKKKKQYRSKKTIEEDHTEHDGFNQDKNIDLSK
ncbi:YihY/virulence factor BrkB family protein [Aureispira]|nr:YihY/virulence factor BrkB family protein [Aureispira sp.]